MASMGRAAPGPVMRWVLLAAGVAVSTAGFVGLVDGGNRPINSWPWWVMGLIGLAMVLLALGSPRCPQTSADEPPDAAR